MTWKNPEKWQKMISGEDCPFCDDIHLKENEFSFMVAETETSYIRLPKNQYWKGWTLVALKRHATELYDLNPEELASFMQDIAMTAKAVKEVFSPVKINYAIFGNLCPHIHNHILPQQLGNAPHAPIKMNAKEVFLDNEEYKEIIDKLRRAISANS